MKLRVKYQITGLMKTDSLLRRLARDSLATSRQALKAVKFSVLPNRILVLAPVDSSTQQQITGVVSRVTFYLQVGQ